MEANKRWSEANAPTVSFGNHDLDPEPPIMEIPCWKEKERERSVAIASRNDVSLLRSRKLCALERNLIYDKTHHRASILKNTLEGIIFGYVIIVE